MADRSGKEADALGSVPYPAPNEDREDEFRKQASEAYGRDVATIEV